MKDKTVDFYTELVNSVDKVKTRAIEFIRKNVIEKHNGHHILTDEETFVEWSFDHNNGREICEIKTNEMDDVYYSYRNPVDNDDWFNINDLCVDDLVYMVAIY